MVLVYYVQELKIALTDTEVVLIMHFSARFTRASAGKISVECVLVTLLAIGVSSCGGASSSGLGHGAGSTGTAITASFSGAVPVAIAEQIGTGSWVTTSLQNGQLSLSVPQGTSTYSIAYVCPGTETAVNSENVIQATTQDATSYTVTCENSATMGSATGTVDASAIAGTAYVKIYGAQGFTISVIGTTGAFSATMPDGVNDIAAIAYDSSYNPVAVTIVRSQTVPFSGLSIIFASTDATTSEPVAISNVPSGFSATALIDDEYFTANGTAFSLTNSADTQYAVVSSTEAQAGDYYALSALDYTTAISQFVYASQATPTASAIPLAFPAALAYAAPTPADLPSFDLEYSGFTGDAAIAYGADLEWYNPSNTLNEITVSSTSAYQNGTTMLAVPDLTALAGFLPSAPSGATVTWLSDVSGGTYQLFVATPSSGTLSAAGNRGTFVEP